MVTTFAAQAGHRRSSWPSTAGTRERLAVFEDRDRIARDLHDLVIQRLFATGMSLQGVMPRIARPRGRRARAAASVDALDDDDQGHPDGDLRAAGARRRHGASGLRARILAVARADDRAARASSPSLRLDGRLDSAGSRATIAEHMLPALREALSNAARQREATQVDVSVEAERRAACSRSVTTASGSPGHRRTQRPGQPGASGPGSSAARSQSAPAEAAAPSWTGGCRSVRCRDRRRRCAPVVQLALVRSRPAS